jgi:hypothetical protein
MKVKAKLMMTLKIKNNKNKTNKNNKKNENKIEK